MKRILWHILALAVLPFIIHTSQAAEQTRPNIVMFLIDDLGYKDLGCYGAKIIETPHIDKLCASGLKMTRAYVTAAVCSPSRASVLTGRHCLELGLWNASHRVKKDTLIYPKLLSQSGYQTWHIGKWHMGREADGTSPEELGFNIGLAGDQSWDPGSHFWPYRNPDNPEHPGLNVPDLRAEGREGEYLADRLTDEALKLIHGRDPSKPFYLNMWHYGVHPPHEAKAKVIEKYERKLAQFTGGKGTRQDPMAKARYLETPNSATYCAMVESIDDSVGRIVEALKKAGLYENTLFIFYSDNGPVSTAAIQPLRGYKNSLYEGGVRVPAFFTWSGMIKPGESTDRIWTLDLFETICGFADVPLPPGHEGPEGMSLVPLLLSGKSVPGRDFYWYFPESRLGWGQRAGASWLGKDDWKYHLFFNGDPSELYNLDIDEAESRNVVSQFPERAALCEDRLVSKLKGSYPMLPKPTGKYEHLIPNIEEVLGLARQSQ